MEVSCLPTKKEGTPHYSIEIKIPKKMRIPTNSLFI